jgi:hypothetical protein
MCKKNEIALPWNQEGPTGPPGQSATLPTGTLTGTQMFVGSLDPNDEPGQTERSFACPGGRVAVAGLGWITLDFPLRQAPILVQIADSNQFRGTFEVDWSFYLDQLTASSRVSWNVTCANIST